MGRVLSIDYGRKRTGIAVTDPLQIVPGGLCTLPTHQLETFLQDYIPREGVTQLVVGKPTQMDGTPSESWRYIEPFLNRLAKLFPDVPVALVDERFTSRLAQRTLLDSGIGRMRRREEKGLVDEISATIILQSWMESRLSPPLYT